MIDKIECDLLYGKTIKKIAESLTGVIRTWFFIAYPFLIQNSKFPD